MPSPLPDDTAPALIRTIGLLGPLLLTIGLLVYRRPDTRLSAATFLASTWVFVTTLAVHLVAEQLGWWAFEADGGVFLGLPVDLWLGWSLFWGAVPILALNRPAAALSEGPGAGQERGGVEAGSWSAPVWVVVAGGAWLDLMLMPACAPVLLLGSDWLAGEAACIALCLLPAQLLGRWTATNRHLSARVMMQAALFSALSLWIIPLIALTATGGSFATLFDRPIWQLSMAGQVLALPGALGIAAVLELYRHGRGTPFPWDQTERLVASGPYAYVANPMQLSMTVIMAGLGLLLESAPVAAAAIVAGAFGSGFARWQEEGDLAARFGRDWTCYRAEVRSWIPRWRPIGIAPATLYYAATCIECSQVASWFASRSPVGLRLLPAEEYPGTIPIRITYVTPDGSVFSGVAALSRAVDHLNLAWAWVGWLGRLPIICHFLQLVVDAVGGGPCVLDVTAPRAPQPAADGAIEVASCHSVAPTNSSSR